MTHIFLDTNTLLQFQDFESIRWQDVVKDEEYTIVICPQVLKEINDHKDSSKGKRRERAKKINHRLSDIIRKRTECKVNISTCSGPSRTSCESLDFNPHSQDDWIVYALIDYKTTDRKVLITNDNGLFLRCQELGVESIDLPEKYLLPFDPTKEELENSQLKKQLKDLLDTKPVLDVLFQGEKSEITHKLIRYPDIETLITDYRVKLKEKYPHKEFTAYKSTAVCGPTVNFNALLGDFAIQEDDVARYNSEIDKFIEKLCEIQRNRLILSAFDQNIHSLDLIVANSGTVISGDMRICLYFPLELQIYSEDAKYNIDVTLPPEPKLQTKSDLKLMSDVQKREEINAILRAPLGYGSPSPPRDYETHWDHDAYLNLENANPYNITVPPLMHYHSQTITNRDKIFFAALKEGDYVIKWLIVDATCPTPFSGELIIHII